MSETATVWQMIDYHVDPFECDGKTYDTVSMTFRANGALHSVAVTLPKAALVSDVTNALRAATAHFLKIHGLEYKNTVPCASEITEADRIPAGIKTN